MWLHGLGADGWDFVPVVEELGLPDTLPARFVFPHAPLRPVTVNAGYVMRAWYDIKAFTPSGTGRRHRSHGIGRANQEVSLCRDGARHAGVRIVLAGFSQGGAVALSTGLRFTERLAGIMALSAYLPFPEQLEAEKSAASSGVPVLMCHGRNDPVVPVTMGLEARDALNANGYRVEWHEYPMQHEVCAAEIAEIGRWLRHVLVGAETR